ncbi:MAG: thermonuclease family protein [Pyrinomonadaceae bacterium]
MPHAFLLVLILCLSVFAQTGKVVAVADGDTITVLLDNKQIKVRLAGIDAPEKGQDMSDAAKRQLSYFVFGETVTLEGSKIDRHGRQVAKVLLRTADINLMLVKFGLAWHYKAYAKEQSESDRDLYSKAEQDARNAKLNIWRLPDPLPPWNYRAGTPTESSLATPKEFPIVANKNSMIFHDPGCRDYNKVAGPNRVYFRDREAAEKAGYRRAKNC